MPLKLIEPRPGKTPYFAVRGTHLGVYLDRSTKTSSRSTATKLLKLWKDEIESGVFAKPGEPTFLDAAASYMAVNNERFLEPILEKIGTKTLRQITQEVIDNLSLQLYPNGTPATRNRQVYTPISAVLKHAKFEMEVKRPKGWRGNPRTEWLKPEQAFKLFAAADNVDAEFGLFLRTLCYTGLRLGEATQLRLTDLELANSYVLARTTKNGDPRGVHLPPHLVAALANHPRGLEVKGPDETTLTKRKKVRTKPQRDDKLFKFVKCGRIYTLLERAKKATGADVAFVTFHTFRHTWAAWMRRYGGLDTTGLIATQAWKDRSAAARYEHADVSEESRKADKLPVETLRKVVG